MVTAVDRKWFEERQEYYLCRPEFVRFQDIAGVDFRDLMADDLEVVRRAQEKLASQSVICHEIRKEHAGFGMPFITYTHDFGFGDSLLHHREELDLMILGGDMADSLRRRHIALSHALLPVQVRELNRRFGEPITILNLGSGVGLDVINALLDNGNGVEKALNYDVNPVALDCGRQLAENLVDKGRLPAGVVEYRRQSLMKCREQGHLALLVGIVCGLEDRMAVTVLRRVYRMLPPGGRILLTSSNQRMLNGSPLGSFIIQHLGSDADPRRSWGLNCRSREAMHGLLAGAGFEKIDIYDDHHYPGRDDLTDDIFWGVDTMPSRILGHRHDGRPLALPPEEIRRRREGYNWLAVAEKPAG